jgi:hypothetical protein
MVVYEKEITYYIKRKYIRIRARELLLFCVDAQLLMHGSSSAYVCIRSCWVTCFFLLILIVWGCSPYWIHSARRPLLAYCTCPGWLSGWRIWWNKDWQMKSKYSEKTCPSASLFTTNPSWPDAGAKPDQRLSASAMARPVCYVPCLVSNINAVRWQLTHP